MNNTQYVSTLGVPVENQQACLQAMQKYGSNHWWEPGVDPRDLAYYQLKEPIMLVEFARFHEAVELLLGRPVWTHEFGGMGIKRLIREAEEKYGHNS